MDYLEEIYEKNLNFKHFESALYLESVSTDLRMRSLS